MNGENRKKLYLLCIRSLDKSVNSVIIVNSLESPLLANSQLPEDCDEFDFDLISSYYGAPPGERGLMHKISRPIIVIRKAFPKEAHDLAWQG